MVRIKNVLATVKELEVDIPKNCAALVGQHMCTIYLKSRQYRYSFIHIEVRYSIIE